MSRVRSLVIGLALLAAAAQPGLTQTATAAEADALDRGRYLAKIAGCNDCHTSGYAQAGGKVPEAQWLTGDQLGWRGPWGTTYPGNLRLFIPTLSEDQWVNLAKTAEFRPPMPWFALHDMTEQDLRALHSFISYLGPAGEPEPAFVPPGQEPKGPYILFPPPLK